MPSGHVLFYTEMLHGQACLNEPRCAAWEVCAPISPEAGCSDCASVKMLLLNSVFEAGCGGCYLIGPISTLPMRIPGWHAPDPVVSRVVIVENVFQRGCC